MATISETQQLYVAYFGRPADPAGLDYWVSTGITTKNFAAAMYAQPEFQQANANLSITNQVNALYLNLFGRSGDTEGLLYWTQQINTGKLTLASIANDLIFAANNNQSAQSKLDKIALDNKTATAVAYTTNVRAASASLLAYNPTSTTPWVTGPQFLSAVTYLATVIATAPTAAATTAAVATMTAISAPSQTFTLTTNIETVPATGVMAANSSITGVINGANSTYQTGDTINGNATSNAAITIAVANANTLVGINTLQSISFRTLAADVVNAQLFNNVGIVASSQSTNVLTVNNSALASTYALSNTSGNVATVNNDGLTIGLRGADISGTADFIKFSVSGVGTAAAGTAAASASVLLSTSTGVEGITVATTGTNIFEVRNTIGAATDYRTLAITGAGANTIDSRNLTQANFYNLSGASGANTLRLDNVLTSGSTVTGGSGADTLRLTPAAGNVVANLTVSAVETLRLSTGSNTGTLLFAAAPNFTTVRIDGDTAEAGTYTIGTVGSFANLNFTGNGETANSNAIQQFNSLTVNGSFTGTSDTVAVRLSNGGVTNTAGLGGTGTITTFTANGVEAINVTLVDVTAAAVSTVNFTSNTLGSVSYSGLGSITSSINAAPASEPGGLTTVNLSGLTTAGILSTVDLAIGSTSTNTVVTASTGGTILNLLGGAASAGDTLNFIGGLGTDTINANVAGIGFRGVIVANLGAGGTDGARQTINTTSFAGIATNVTSTADASFNTINVNGSGAVSLVASGAGSVNTVTAAAITAATAAGTRQVNTITYATAPGAGNLNGQVVVNGQVIAFLAGANTADDAAIAAVAAINAATLGVTAARTGAGVYTVTGPVVGSAFTIVTSPQGAMTANNVPTTAAIAAVVGVNTTLTGAGSTSAIAFTGGVNADTITGGAGADTITGAAGADRMTGGTGADRFIQNAGATANASADGTVGGVDADEFRNGETLIMGAGVASFDIITDFVAGTDVIRLGTGVAGATLLTGANGAGSVIGAAGNFGIRGTLTNATTFTAVADGLSMLLLTSTAALNNNEETTLGTNFTVLQNTVLSGAQLTAAIVA